MSHSFGGVSVCLFMFASAMIIHSQKMEWTEVGEALEVTSWTTASLLSALLEILVAFVLLIGATISYLTSIIVKCSGLRPPCFHQGGSLIEGRLVRRNFFCDRHSEKFQTLTHLLPGGHWESNVSETCSHSSSGTDDNPSTCFNSSSTCFDSASFENYPSGKGISQFRSRTYLKRQVLGETDIGNKDDSTLKDWTRCIYCSSPFPGTSEQRATKRKFANIIVEELPGCSSEVSDEEDLGHNAALGFIELERASSSKVFPEDVLAIDFENRKGSLDKPFDAMASEKNLELCEDVSHEKADESPLEGAIPTSSLPEFSLQSNDDREEHSQHSGLVSADMVMQSDSRIAILLPTNFSLEVGEQQYDSQRREGSQTPPLVSLVGKDEYSLQFEEMEMKAADVNSEAENVPLELEIDTYVLRKTLNAERQVLNAVYLELEQERNASAIATNETMAMITRLQKEKAALQMEARQFQRIAEEKAMYDQEAIAVLKDILMKREAEKLALEKEVELYRRRLLKDRIEELERTTKELDGDRVVAAVEDSKESMIQEDPLSERNFAKGSVSTSLQFNDARNLPECFLALDAEHVEKQCQDSKKFRSSISTAHSPVAKTAEDSAHDGSGDKHIVDPRNVTIGQSNQATLFDERDRCFTNCQVQLTPDTPMTIKLDGDAVESKMIRKPRSNGEEKWQIVLERLGNLESQIQHLRKKENPEIHDMPVADQRGFFCKGLGVEGAQFVTPARKMFGCRFDEDKGSFEPKQWYSSGKKGVMGDRDLSIKPLGKKLSITIDCNDSAESSEVQSEKKCTPNITDNSQRIWSGHSFICQFDQNSNEQNTMIFRSHPTDNGTFHGEGINLDLGFETPEERSRLVTMDADNVSCSLLPKSPLAGDIMTNGGIENQDSLDSLNEQLPTVSRVLDFRTTSMVIRDNSRMAVDQEVQKLTSRLQVLEADRELMRQTIDSMKEERGEVKLLQEVAHQLQELHSFKSESSQQKPTSSSSGSPSKSDKSLLKKRRCGSGRSKPTRHFFQPSITGFLMKEAGLEQR